MYDEQLSFFTSTSSAACGISPDIDGEYLFGLYWSGGSSDSTDDGQLGANLCGLFREWSTVDEDELDELDELEGCTSDACDGECNEFEVLHSMSSDCKQSVSSCIKCYLFGCQL